MGRLLLFGGGLGALRPVLHLGAHRVDRPAVQGLGSLPVVLRAAWRAASCCSPSSPPTPPPRPAFLPMRRRGHGHRREPICWPFRWRWPQRDRVPVATPPPTPLRSARAT
ncbi:hypothetical protein QJS66_11590 [Kocuria rhizophila]|nr:hypothetical protein QJS66_11590 [Kocuria rhizophila]